MPPLIELSGVRKRYPGQDRPALDGVDLQIEAGGVFGLLGPNGAGKTTLLSVLLGLRRADAGVLQIAGHDPSRDPASVRAQCGLAPQGLAFYPSLSVRDNLRCFAGIAGLRGSAAAARIDDVAAKTRLADRLEQRAETLSGGLKRRLNLAIALLPRPSVLCLDEPTVGVDPQARGFLLEVIRQLADEGTTVIYTSHYLDEVEAIADRLAILDNGRVLCAGTLDALRGEPALRLRLAGLAGDALRTELRARFPAVQLRGRELLLPGDDAETELPALRELLAASGCDVLAWSFGPAGLEERFLALTGRRLRD